jgi:hypothetical protein
VAGNGPSGGRTTQRQLDTIVKIALAKGLKPDEIDGMSLRKFRRKPVALSAKEAAGGWTIPVLR